MRFGFKKEEEKPIIIKDYRGRGRRRGRRRRIDEFVYETDRDNRILSLLEKYSLIVHVMLSLLIIFAIEWISHRSFSAAVTFVTEHTLPYLFNSMIIFVTLLIPYIFRHRGFFRICVCVFWMLLGVVNGLVLNSRVTPFNFTDLKLVGDLLSMKSSKYFTVAQGVIVIIALAALLVFLILFYFNGPFYKKKIHRVRNAIVFAAAVACVPFITKAAIHTGVMASYFGNLAQGYKEYGFVYSFIASTVDTGMSEPSRYSEEAIDEITASVQTETTLLSDDELPNIIFVQLESFIDPSEIEFLELSDNPCPNYTYLMENYTSGRLTVPIVGAGTSNTEFEVLTGLAIQYFGLGEYPYKTILKETDCESAASDLSSIGYATHAIHNNGGTFYSRNKVFANMGFDTYTSKELMDIQTYNEIGSWPTDDILVEETLKALDSTEDQSDFVFTISVQSHGSYPTYEVFEDPVIEVSGADTEEENYQWEYFVNQIYEVDQFIGDLIEALSERDEKTIVVFYGDHLPTMGLEDDDMEYGDLYQTSYVTWNNFGLEKNDADLYTYQLMAYIMDELGIHEGTVFTYHQSEMEEETTDESSYLSDLKLLQYDILYGERYVYDGEDAFPATDLEMGVVDVEITNVYVSSDNATVNIWGSNFTPWSKVYVNGEKIATQYMSSSLLRIALDELEDGCTIVVSQVGSGSTIFRSSNSISFEMPDDIEESMILQADIEDTKEEDIETTDPADEKLMKAILQTILQADEDHLND